jgi:hypothetical protein
MGEFSVDIFNYLYKIYDDISEAGSVSIFR